MFNKYRSILHTLLFAWKTAPCIDWSSDADHLTWYSDCARFRITRTYYDAFYLTDYQAFRNTPTLKYDTLEDAMQLAQVRKDAALTRRKF